MSAELVAILAVGVTLGVAMFAAFANLRRDLRGEIGEIRRDLNDVRERLAKLEGLFEGLILRDRRTEEVPERA